MRITWLLEATDRIWGGVKVALEDANWLTGRGHQVTVLSRTPPPAWMALRCPFRQVPDFRPEHLPDSDLLIGTFWTTVPWAAGAHKGVPVHYCQGYEGDNPENTALRDRIEAVYRLPGVHHVTISPHLTATLRRRFDLRAREIVYAIDHDVHFPGPERTAASPLRVGLVGPWQVPWKDLATGVDACRLAHAAGQPLVLVRVTNTQPDAAEHDVPFAVEWHERVPPAQMGEIYRSLDVFLGTSSGDEEGFFLPAIEAMACGVPCVLTDIPCFRGYGSGQHALFVPPRDPAAMAEALVTAARVPHVRAALRQTGLQTAARYRREAHGEQLEQALLAIAVQARAQTRPALALVREDAAPATVATTATPAGRIPAAPATPAPALAPTASPAATAPAGARDPEPVLALVRDLRRRVEDIGSKLRSLGAPARASDTAAAGACLDRDPVTLRRELARSCLEAGDRHGALRLYDELVLAGHADGEVHAERGLLQHALGDEAGAARSFQNALALGVRSADACNSLGVALFRSGDHAGARQAFEQALVLQPGHADAAANLRELPAA